MRLGTMLGAFRTMVARHVRRARQGRHDGQVMVEFAIVFPLQLFLVAGIMQYSLIVVAHVMTNHAAFMAARAALVADDVAALKELGVTLEASGGGSSPDALEQTYAEEAAWTVIATVAGSSGVSNASGNGVFMYPGLGGMPRRAAAKKKTEVEFVEPRDGDVITVRVTHDYELVIPVAGSFFAFPYRGFFGGLFGGGTRDAVTADEKRARDTSKEYRAPHIPILEVCVMVRPWKRFRQSREAARFPANSRHGLGLPPLGP